MDIKEFFLNDRFATEAGVKLAEVLPGYSKAEMTLTPHHMNAGGTTQGGAIFTLADLALAAAANSHGKLALSLDASIHFFLPSKPGDTLTAEAKEKHVHKRTGYYQVEVRNQHGELVACFDTTVYRKDTDLPFRADD